MDAVSSPKHLRQTRPNQAEPIVTLDGVAKMLDGGLMRNQKAASNAQEICEQRGDPAVGGGAKHTREERNTAG